MKSLTISGLKTPHVLTNMTVLRSIYISQTLAIYLTFDKISNYIYIKIYLQTMYSHIYNFKHNTDMKNILWGLTPIKCITQKHHFIVSIKCCISLLSGRILLMNRINKC